jgi:hypothetical protein
MLSPEEHEAVGLGLAFVPTPRRSRHLSLEFLNSSFASLIRAMRLRLHFGAAPAHLTKARLPSLWSPPPGVSLALEEYLDATLGVLRNRLAALANPGSRGNMSRRTSDALNRLLSRPDLRLDPSDKTRVPVLSDTVHFNRECLRHLNDRNTYAPLNPKQAARILVSLSARAKRLLLPFSMKLPRGSPPPLVSETATAFMLKDIDNPKAANFYILWKTHKPVVVGRPISSNVGYASYNISVWLDEQLRPLVRALPTALHSSRDLALSLDNFSLPPAQSKQRLTFASQDVTALYPSIDLTRGLAAVRRTLLRFGRAYSAPRIELIMSLLGLVLRHMLNVFDGAFFLQQRGTAMGTPVAVAFAVIFMFDLEFDLVNSFTTQGLLLLYKRYIDDLFMIFKDTSSASRFCSLFNRLDPNIEISGRIGPRVDFMDLTIFKGPRLRHGGIDTKLYVKPINRFLYLPYNSYHTVNAKSAFVLSELHRFLLNNTLEENFVADKAAFLAHLRARGHPFRTLRNPFDAVLFRDRDALLARLRAPPPPKPPTPPVFILNHDPVVEALDVNSALRKHWHLIRGDPSLPFDRPPMLVRCNQSNILALSRRLRNTPRDPQAV